VIETDIVESSEQGKEEPDAAPSPSSAIPSESPTNKILRLLKVVHTLTVEARSVSSRNDQMDETLFVNNKLTAKLTRQLEEVMILARYVLLLYDADCSVVVYQTGLPSCLEITPFYSPLRPDTRSSNPRLLATPD
jgi:hypothetical protein